MYAVVRSYKRDRVVNLIRQIDATGIVNHLTVVINREKDEDRTPKLLNDLECAMSVATVSPEEYGWAKALNAGIRSLPPIADDHETILVVSNEVRVVPEDVKLLRDKADSPTASCGYALFEGRNEPTYRLPRNTYIVWNRRVIESLDLFDEDLDHVGMEDYDMVLRAYKSHRLLPFVGPTSVRLDIAEDSDFVKKCRREVQGVEEIEKDCPPDVVAAVRGHIAQQNGD